MRVFSIKFSVWSKVVNLPQSREGAKYREENALKRVVSKVDVSKTGIVSKKYTVLYKKLKTLVDLNFMKNLSVNDYASKLNVYSTSFKFCC